MVTLKGNILINDIGDANLCDYGLSRILEVSGFTTKTQSATWRYVAPELFQLDEGKGDPRVTVETDSWAFAMTVIEIFTESMPFPHIQSDLGVIYFVSNGGRPNRLHCTQINDDIWAMLEKCWDTEPVQRPSMTTLSRFFAVGCSRQPLL